MFKQRILIQLSVRGDIRFVSHHDLLRVLGRSVRRAGLPVAMSEGFNPRQKISLLLARGVGVASESEFAEIDLHEWTSVTDVARRLNEHLPEGLQVQRAVLGHPRSRQRVVGIDYRVDCRTDVGVTGEHVRRLFDCAEVWVERARKKSGAKGDLRRVNIRPFIKSVRVGGRSVEISLRVSDRGTTRPEEVWQALGLEAETLLAHCTITRTRMELSPSF